jgi:hypothetical protein
VIEVTDEMVQAYDEAAWESPIEVCGLDMADVRAGLAAVLALVERDYPATEYTLSPLPEGDINSTAFEVKVAYRGRGLWAVSRHRQCLARSGEWDWESIPSERTDEWLAEHRFPLDEALRLAREELPNLRVNGMTAAEVSAWAEQRRNQAGGA